MRVALADLHACFEGVIPSIIATVSADGTPNISYLSHVVMIDDDHIALSNQFFAKTAANVRANPHATLMLVDGNNGTQYTLDIEFQRSVDNGVLFDHIALHLKASSAQVGMAGIMRLRSADIFRVHEIRIAKSNAEIRDEVANRRPAELTAVARIAEAIDRATDVGGIMDALLAGLSSELSCKHALVLLNDPAAGVLTTVGSIGYERSGLGSEVRGENDLIASAAAHGRPIKVSDMSRVRRMGEAIIHTSGTDENEARTIALPRLADAMSQLAVPIIVRQAVRGVIFVESNERLAFRDEDVAAIEILGRQTAAALALSETEAFETIAAPSRQAPSTSYGEPIAITHHAFDDSIFIGNDYVIKGVAGRLLAYLIDRSISEGRSEFTNREIRLTEALRLPDLKDNLETRLLLLRRRLEAKGFPIQIVHVGRGRIRLDVAGTPTIRKVD
ncbi:GAF domain-containing protein [Rhizobium sp. KVB221]|uniref:GAF domain-containing protein n=1 Tax=Rhizobium setariae TaxID=2801340 RepID=A0A937CQW8_9HYPH|nr:GAF domain-containing protein [Rhizobium setariae]MBL0374528.1 GAF domain-containing protein [Rhizobium setariae]